jgi:phosphoserine phosphatase
MAQLASSISPEQLAQVLEVSRMLAVTTEVDPLLRRIADACCAMLGCERSSIFLHDSQTDQLWTKIALKAEQEIRFSTSVGIAGHVFREGGVYNCPRCYDDPKFNREPDKETGFVTRNLLAAAMVDVDRQRIGVIQAINKREWGGFTLADESLIQLLADQAGVAIQRYQLQQAAMQGVALRREMELAKEIQEALIPQQPPAIPGIECIGWTQPASITGGDCFDLWQLADGRLGIFLADASGHGIGPALVVSQARALVRSMCDLEPDPSKLLARVNHRLWDDLETGRFVTAFIGILDPQTGDLSWSSAGHGPILIRSDPDRPVQAFDALAPPLGIVEDFRPDAAPRVRLSKHGSIYVISDGIFEAVGETGGEFGVNRVIEILSSANCGIQRQLDELRTSVKQWQGKSEALDDQTIVIARRTLFCSPSRAGRGRGEGRTSRLPTMLTLLTINRFDPHPCPLPARESE